MVCGSGQAAAVGKRGPPCSFRVAAFSTHPSAWPCLAMHYRRLGNLTPLRCTDRPAAGMALSQGALP